MTRQEYQKQYREANRERLREQKKRYAKSAAGVECHKAAMKRWRDKNKDRERERRRKAKASTPEKIIMQRAKARAILRKVSFDLDVSDIAIPKTCPILGIPLAFSVKRTKNTPSIDRISPSFGYVRGNVHIISWQANKLKNDGTIEELIAMGRWAQCQA